MSYWRAGQEWHVGGVDVRVVTGRKGPDDLRLEMRAMEYVPVKMDLGFILADFFTRNEDVLYPPKNGRLGGEMYLNSVRIAAQAGWEVAARLLAKQRANKKVTIPSRGVR